MHLKNKMSKETAFRQLITEEGKFDGMWGEYLKKTTKVKGNDYFIVSTFGPQSSGKSTLLNCLFKTKFPVMDPKEGRYQVTKGVYTCIPQATKDLKKDRDREMILFDLEGNDSIERNEDRFDQKISLFALATSQILIVNSLLTDIGRYVASNISLLKTSFELNLKLFQANKKKTRTLLLFVIRDFDDHTQNFPKLKSQVMEKINGIWKDLIKPKGYEDSVVNDFFDLRFVTLPHFVYFRENFDKKIETMKRFFNEESKEFLYKQEYSKYVPIDGLPIYLSTIWKTIMENKDLDIPTQRKMLAIFRCDEIKLELMKELTNIYNKWKETIDKGKLITKMGIEGHKRGKKIMEEFKNQTELYVPEIVDEKKESFWKEVKEKYKEVFLKQVGLLRKSALSGFKKLLEADVNEIISRKEFSSTVKEYISKHTEGFFTARAKDSVFMGENWDDLIVTEKEVLRDEIEEFVVSMRKEQMTNMKKGQIDMFKKSIDKKLTVLLKKRDSKFWMDLRDFIGTLFTNERSETLKNFKLEMQSFACNENEREGIISDILITIKDHVKYSIKKDMQYIDDHLKNSFDVHFPEILDKSVNVFELFVAARNKALQVLNLFFISRLEDGTLDDLKITWPEAKDNTMVKPDLNFIFPPIEDKKVILINEEKMKMIFKDFCHEIQIKLLSAKNSQERLNATSIPWYVYLLIIVLGFDEFMYVLKNPWLLILLVILFVVFGWQYTKRKLIALTKSPHINPMLKMGLKYVMQYLPALFDTDKKKEKEN